MKRDQAEGSAGEEAAKLLGLDSIDWEPSWAPILICYKVSQPDIVRCSTYRLEEDSPERDRLGLGDEPAFVLMRQQGDEFARLEGPQATLENLIELLRLYEAESKILAEAASGRERACADLVRLMLAQRRLSASIVAWKGLQAEGDQQTLCLLARRIADLALELTRCDEAIPLLQHIVAHSKEELHRIEAWSRLIRCHLILGNKEEADRLSSKGNRPSDMLRLG